MLETIASICITITGQLLLTTSTPHTPRLSYTDNLSTLPHIPTTAVTGPTDVQQVTSVKGNTASLPQQIP